MATIFSRIIAGELPGHFVWKDPEVVAFLTIQPFSEGHVLVVPRAEVDHWDDLPEALSQRVMVVAQRIAKAIKAVYAPRRVGLIVAGFEVPHTHLHVIPTEELGDLNFARARASTADELAATAARLREALVAQGHAEARP